MEGFVFGSIEKDKAKEFLPKLVDVASPSVFERAVASLQNSNLDARASATDILVALPRARHSKCGRRRR